MFRYYLFLALKSLRRTPGLTALMVSAIGLGISACIVTLTVYHAMSGNPIWWKNQVLYAVTVDPRPAPQAGSAPNPNGAPDQLTYLDATSLYRSKIPRHKALIVDMAGGLRGAPGQTGAVLANVLGTSGGFFRMFDVPFEYGGPWSATSSPEPLPVLVLSRHENEKLFGGADSVGRTLLFNHHPFRIVGVLEHWDPEPRFYDMTVNAFGHSPDAFVPFGWDAKLRLWPNGHMSCWSSSTASGFRQLLGSNCVWILMWVELPNAGSVARFRDFLAAYWAQQHNAGRFQRPHNYHLWRVNQWLVHHHVVTNNSRLLLRLAFAFLAVCLINTVGVELTKFLRTAPLSGFRRALGASRRQIIEQHLVETALIAIAGAALGLALSWAELHAIHALYSGTQDAYGQLAHFGSLGVLWALGLAALATLTGGLYPAWRIGQISPARFLNSQ